MLIADKYEFPEKCPEKCPGHTVPAMQGGRCHRCPIFNCAPCENDGFRLIEPENYSPELAEIYAKYIHSAG
jgi:hypothetical protein